MPYSCSDHQLLRQTIRDQLSGMDPEYTQLTINVA
jgi:hypothetical protein